VAFRVETVAVDHGLVLFQAEHPGQRVAGLSNSKK
jgi:hypothetical protein